MGEEIAPPDRAKVGEGTELLARLTGRDATDLNADRRKLVGGLLALGSEATSLLRGYASEDPTVRDAAYRRWAELDAMLPKPRPADAARTTGLSGASRERLRVGLTKLVDALRDVEQAAHDEVTRETGSPD
jgi:hypothetical protein